jgi:hypothetical protein
VAVQVRAVRVPVGDAGEGTACLLRCVQVAELGDPPGVFETRAEAEGRAVMTSYSRFVGQAPVKAVRCRMGFHFWSGWMREIERVYAADEGEGTITFTVYQWRRCYDCGQGDGAVNKDVLCTGTLTPTQSVWRGFITAAENETLGTHPLTDLDFGMRLDLAAGLDGDRFGAGRQTAMMGWRCRVGLHRYSSGCCLRCAHLGHHFRSWATFFAGRTP